MWAQVYGKPVPWQSPENVSVSEMQSEVTRPVLRYHGGKWRTAKWILQYFPPHRVYVEPYGGAGSVLMQKPRTYAEVYNDLDSEVVNVFRVLRDPEKMVELRWLLWNTPFSREEFILAFDPCDYPVEQARRTILKSYAGFGSDSIHRGKKIGMRTRPSPWGQSSQWGPPGFRSIPSTHRADTGFRADSNRSGTTPAKDWASYPDSLIDFCERLRGVVIENRPALKVIPQYDYPDTLFYVDPPYVSSTRRDARHGYLHDFVDRDHVELAKVLHEVKGMVVLSAYHSPLYEELYRGWKRVESEFLVHGSAKATEVLWLSGNVSPRQLECFE